MKNTTSYRHAVNSGDLIASLAGIRQIWKLNQKKAIIYQQLNVPAKYFNDANHPVKDRYGNTVCMSSGQLEMLIPLLKSQEYVEDVFVYMGQKVGVDLDVIRGQTFCNMPYGPIQKWVWMAFPDMACDLSEPWINVEPSDVGKGKIIINFTERYRNNTLHYFFLKEHEEDLVFAGTEQEAQSFCDQWGLSIPVLIVSDFLELAKIIKGSRFFMGNQSFCWNLAEAMKVPRILELCKEAPNCTSFGPDGYEVFHQMPLEYYFETLFNKTK